MEAGLSDDQILYIPICMETPGTFTPLFTQVWLYLDR